MTPKTSVYRRDYMHHATEFFATGTAIRRGRFLRIAERVRGFVFPRRGLWLGLRGVDVCH